MMNLLRSKSYRRSVCFLVGLLGVGWGVPPTFAQTSDSMSRPWQTFLEQTQAGEKTDLPDYSYAGYRNAEVGPQARGPAVDRVFDVTDYGATPDDLTDDRAAIQKAIDAAEAAGGGTVFLPRGRYLVNTDMNNRGAIKVRHSNIVLKGEGASAGGTIIHSIHPFGGGDPHNPTRLHLGDNVLVIHSLDEEKPLSAARPLCRVIDDAASQSFSVTVDDPSALEPGQTVYLYARNREILKEMIAVEGSDEYAVRDEWTNISERDPYTVEIHEIVSIDDGVVTFREPLRYDVQARHGWELREHQPIREVGVEDISFMGNAYHRYKHHRSGYDDSGWAMVKFKGVRDGWVRRCSFINVSQAVAVTLSSNVSILNILVDGNVGHHIPRITWYCHNVLGGLITDRAGFTHGPSLSGGVVGTVFWRCASQGSIDSHAGRPFVSLFDLNRGGPIRSAGGTRDYPQHLRHLTIWNFEHLPADNATQTINYDFWPDEGVNVFLQPVIVGFWGAPATFEPSRHLAVLESHGQPVQPESLYQAQLTQRLGAEPAWVEQALADHVAMLASELPPHFDRDDQDSQIFLYPETFRVDEMLDYLTSLSLQMWRSRQFTYVLETPDLQMHTDQGLVRNTLYSLMNALYAVTTPDNRIHVRRQSDAGSSYLVFAVESVKPDLSPQQLAALRRPAPASAVHLEDAATYAALIGGHIRSPSSDAPARLEAWFPAE